MAGGSGTRLWPMSRAEQPKQLIPFINGRSLLQIALERLEGLVPAERRHICAGTGHKDAVMRSLPGFPEGNYIAEPMGRDTLNAVALSAAVIRKQDPEAVIAVFTADHLITPEDAFRAIVEQGYALAESEDDTLVTFGIAPTEPATGYGYLQLGEPIDDATGDAFVVDEFKEKPEQPVADDYFAAGPEKYLWNSGMFVWKAATVMSCVEKYAPENHEQIATIADAWGTPRQGVVLEETYPQLKKISVDFAIMEPASRDDGVTVAAVPMPLSWLDVGSWPSFAETCAVDEGGNAIAAEHQSLIDCKNTLIASEDPGHLVTAIGCEDLIIIHTPNATLVCPKDRAQDIKQMQAQVDEAYK